ncbi:hypothetical protein ACFQZ4_54375 [Catellatospora coxensis]|uniref:Uncharacterized protein n=1 Tax=Catellatospora coxensis TaxID=310354 RepID=A0A8J3LAK9_9ACTN|nr:hypothetical protein [Catellatospora coxensis]GIG11065.1 hypothetical protein Cco03nite_77650 [Catellatospora coxensis]
MLLHIDNPTPAQVLMLNAERSAQRWHVALAATIATTAPTFTAWLVGAPGWVQLPLVGLMAVVSAVAGVLNRRYRADLASISDFIEQTRNGDADQA